MSETLKKPRRTIQVIVAELAKDDPALQRAFDAIAAEDPAFPAALKTALDHPTECATAQARAFRAEEDLKAAQKAHSDLCAQVSAHAATRKRLDDVADAIRAATAKR